MLIENAYTTGDQLDMYGRLFEEEGLRGIVEFETYLVFRGYYGPMKPMRMTGAEEYLRKKGVVCT